MVMQVEKPFKSRQRCSLLKIQSDVKAVKRGFITDIRVFSCRDEDAEHDSVTGFPISQLLTE